MSWDSALLIASTFAYAGFQATIRLLVYPSLAQLSGADFLRSELAHQRRVTKLVGPLFAFLALSIVLSLVDTGLNGSGARAVLGSGGCFVAILVVTGLAAVPQHRRLSRGVDRAAMRKLLVADSVRLVLALVACGCAVLFAAAG